MAQSSDRNEHLCDVCKNIDAGELIRQLTRPRTRDGRKIKLAMGGPHRHTTITELYECAAGKCSLCAMMALEVGKVVTDDDLDPAAATRSFRSSTLRLSMELKAPLWEKSPCSRLAIANRGGYSYFEKDVQLSVFFESGMFSLSLDHHRNAYKKQQRGRTY